MIGSAFECAVDSMIEGAVDGCARHQPHIAAGDEIGSDCSRPVCAGLLVDFMGFGVEAPSRNEVLVGQNHAKPGSCGCQCSGKAGRSGTDHKEVAVQESVIVNIRVRLHGKPAQACGGTDQRFVEPLPKRLRPHEGLVVEAGRKEW